MYFVECCSGSWTLDFYLFEELKNLSQTYQFFHSNYLEQHSPFLAAKNPPVSVIEFPGSSFFLMWSKVQAINEQNIPPHTAKFPAMIANLVWF